MIASLFDFKCVKGANVPDNPATYEETYGDLNRIDLAYPLMASARGVAGSTNGQLPLAGIDMAWLQECVAARAFLLGGTTGTDFGEHYASLFPNFTMSHYLETFYRTPLRVSLAEVWTHVKAFLSYGCFVSNSAICDGGAFEGQMYPYQKDFFEAVKDLGISVGESDITPSLKDWPADDLPITNASSGSGRHAFDKDMIFTLEMSMSALCYLCLPLSLASGSTVTGETTSGDEESLEYNPTLVGTTCLYRERRHWLYDSDSKSLKAYSSTRQARLETLGEFSFENPCVLSMWNRARQTAKYRVWAQIQVVYSVVGDGNTPGFESLHENRHNLFVYLRLASYGSLCVYQSDIASIVRTVKTRYNVDLSAPFEAYKPASASFEIYLVGGGVVCEMNDTVTALE